MIRFMSYLFLSALLWAACAPQGEELIPLPTEICVLTSHHGQEIPDAVVYLKYNVDTFPGYGQPPGYYDASFRTGSNGKGCIAPVPEGKHWLVAFGYDSLHYPHDVFGSLPVHISLDGKPKLDTILYVSEKH